MSVASIKIKRGHGWDDTPIDAQLYGAFAVHPPDGPPARYWKDRNFFVVTHVATGMQLGSWSREHARTIARKLNRVLPPGNFDESDFGTEPYLIFVAKAKALIKQVIRSEATT